MVTNIYSLQHANSLWLHSVNFFCCKSLSSLNYVPLLKTSSAGNIEITQVDFGA